VSTEPMTFGAEEEFFIVDLESGELTPRSDELVAAGVAELGGVVTHELNRCQVEIASVVCSDIDELRRSLTLCRSTLAELARDMGCGLVASGTHPSSSWEDQEIKDDVERYERLERRYQAIARQQVICGCHVHVGIDDPETAVAVTNRAVPWLPPLLALSANSPYWHGVDTGFDSYRTEVWERWPTSGMPPQLDSRKEYDELIDELQSIRAIEDPTQIYWYVRPSERWPTVEFRPCDVCTELEDALALAALIRALAWTSDREEGVDEMIGSRSREASNAAMWRAARFGMSGALVDPLTDQLQPAQRVVQQLLDHVGDGLEVHGDTEFVTLQVKEIIDRGTGASIQRRTLEAEGGDTVALVRSLVDRTDPGRSPD
jgi:carboxylate-amine ligase